MLTAVAALAIPASAAPLIVVEQPSWDFGIVTNCSELTHDFRIRNAGDASLNITQVRSSCNLCLHANADKRIVPPGGSTLIHCHLDLHALSGQVTRAVVLTCNDPTNPSPVLSLTGISVPVYSITPLELTLDLASGQAVGQAQIVTLQNLHAPLSRALSDNSNLVATVQSAGVDRFILTVEARPSLPIGHWVSSVTLRSEDSNDPPCRVLAFVHHPPDLELLPAELRFQPLPNAQTRILWLKQHGPKPLALLDAVPSSDWLHCEIEPDPSGPNYKIFVTATHQNGATAQNASVTLKLRDELGADRSVPVSVLVDPAEADEL